MRLGIISDCIHIRDKQGRIGSANHVYVMQMNELASHFSKTIFCTPVLDAGPDTPKLSYYNHSGIQFQALPQAGGKTWRDKLHLLAMVPRWFKAFGKLGGQVDLIYQRFPNNLNIPGFFYVLFKRKPAFATYTGTWHGYKGESITYKLQRYLLKLLYPGPVFVYDFMVQHQRIFPTISPSYSMADWEAESECVKMKIQQIQIRRKNEPVVLMSVGSLIDYKNHRLLLQACVLLKEAHCPFKLYIAGEGILRKELLLFIEENQLDNDVELIGQIPQDELRAYYRQAHFVIQPSIIEGYGKVPVEAMFHGAVPLLSPVSIHPYFVGETNQRGAIFSLADAEQIVTAISLFTENTNKWCNAIQAGRQFSSDFTIEAWTKSILTVLDKKGIYT